MGKGLIGNSLSYTMTKILSGEISAEDIDKIYAGTCFTEETMSELLSAYQTCWDSAALDRARREVCEKYGVQKFRELRNEEDYDKAYDEVYARGDELRPTVAAEAEQLLHKLWDEGRIIQTRYRVPKGQTVKARYFPDGSTEYEVTGTGQERYDEILDLNGEYYFTPIDNVASLGLQTSGLFNNELELIANQLYCGWSWDDNSRHDQDRLIFFEKMFPQYKDVITEVGGKLNSGLTKELREQGILEMLQEALKERGEHTAEEIGEGIADLTQGEVGEALSAITDIGEPQKDPHTLE